MLKILRITKHFLCKDLTVRASLLGELYVAPVGERVGRPLYMAALQTGLRHLAGAQRPTHYSATTKIQVESGNVSCLPPRLNTEVCPKHCPVRGGLGRRSK